MNICIFGDSTAWGAWDKDKGGWANRLWLDIAKKDLDIELYNLSISGGTTDTILNRFESEAKIRNANVLIFQTGGNDSAYDNTADIPWVTKETYRSNLEEIIKRAKGITQKIIFIGFKNCDESRTMPVYWQKLYYTNKNIKEYNYIMKDVCDKNQILFLDIFGLLENKDLEDGLHPNENGHKKLFQVINNFLIKNNIIS